MRCARCFDVAGAVVEDEEALMFWREAVGYPISSGNWVRSRILLSLVDLILTIAKPCFDNAPAFAAAI